MSRWIRALSVVCTALVLMMATGLPAQAEAGRQVDRAMQAMLDHQAKVAEAADRLTPYVSLAKDGTLSLNIDGRSLRKLGITDEAFKEVRGGMQAINEGIRAGELVADETGRVAFKATGESSITANENRVDLMWYGIRWGFSNTVVQQILAIIAIGLGGAAIAGAIMAAIPGLNIATAVVGVLAGLLAVAGGWLAYINAPGRGIFIHTSYTGNIYYGTSQ